MGTVGRIADLAPSLHVTKTILPFARARLFTKGWRWLYQAHHLVEVEMAGIIGIKNTDDLPAIILTDVEHRAITSKLNAVRKEVLLRRKLDQDALWEIYEKAYRDDPIWLEAIRHYFQK